jgi:2-methylcitrate dehydratase PrpD
MGRAISEQIASYISSIKFDDLSPAVIEQTKACLLDWLGCTWIGAQTPLGKKAIEFALRQGRNGTSTIVGAGERTSTWAASFVNGFNSHVEELDDVYEGSYYHPGVAAVAAALAVAEAERNSGKDLICAVAAGYEVGIRIALAVNPSHYEFWHTTGTVGTFAAAVAAGKLLGLSGEQFVWALGNAGTQAAGLWQFVEEGAMSKPLHPGKAALGGVMAAYLAAAGVTGAKYIFEGKKGFCRAMSTDAKYDTITAGLGEDYLILGVSPKRFASCFYTHPAIRASLILREKLKNRIGAISRIEIWTDRVSAQIAGLTDVTASHQAKFSIGFCFALGLIWGKAGRDEFAQEALNNRDVRNVFTRTSLVVEPKFSEGFPRRKRCKVVVTLTDGEVLVEEADTAGKQTLSLQEIRTKLLDVIGMPDNLVAGAYKRINSLPDIPQITGCWDALP